MRCPFCDTELNEEALTCPSCGMSQAAEPEQETEAEQADLRVRAGRYANLPGIYAFDPEEDEDAAVRSGKRAGQRNILSRLKQYFAALDSRSRYNLRLSAAMIGGTLLLFLIISCFYAPNAVAVTGRDGISMNNREFYIYYRNAYSSYLSSATDGNGNVSVPFSTERRLDRQYYNLETGYSWQDYFMDTALYNAGLTEVLVAEAKAAGFVLSESEQAEVDRKLAAIEEGYEGGLEAYVAANCGGPVTAAVYESYLRDSALAQAYYQSISDSYVFTEEELLAEYYANTADYQDLTLTEMPDVNIRHILYVPAGDTQEAWDAAEEKALSALEACEESDDTMGTFLSLVTESQDSGSAGNGGLLETLYPGAIGGTLDEWCFDSTGRETGDMAVVMSGYGWHLVLFEGYCETTRWKTVVDAALRQEAASAYMLELYEAADCRLTAFADVP